MSRPMLSNDEIVRLVADNPDPQFCSKMLKLLNRVMLQRNNTIMVLGDAVIELNSKAITWSTTAVSFVCTGISCAISLLELVFIQLTWGTSLLLTSGLTLISYGASGVKGNHFNEQLRNVKEELDKDLRCYSELQGLLGHPLPFEPPTCQISKTLDDFTSQTQSPKLAATAKRLQANAEWLGLIEIALKVSEQSEWQSTEASRQGTADNFHEEGEHSIDTILGRLKNTIKQCIKKMKMAVSVASTCLKGLLKSAIWILEMIEDNLYLLKGCEMLKFIGKPIPVISNVVQVLMFLVDLSLNGTASSAIKVIQEQYLAKLMDSISPMIELKDKLLEEYNSWRNWLKPLSNCTIL